MKELFTTGSTVIPLIKGGAQRHTLTLSPYLASLSMGISFVAGYTSDLKFLIKGKSLQDPFFSSALKLDVAIARETFDRELNNILKSASARLGKHLRTHSFRATLITDLLENTPIDVVKDFPPRHKVDVNI